MPYLLVTLYCAFVALGSFLFGYDMGVISSAIKQPHFLRHFHHPSDAATGGIVASYTAGGAIVGSVLVPYLSDPWGRRLVLLVGALLASFGAALQAGAVTIAMLIAGRFIAGLAIGLMSATVPVYCVSATVPRQVCLLTLDLQSEVAPPRIRGFEAAMQQWMMGLGVMVAQWIGFGCTYTNSSFSWRFPLSLQALPSLFLSVGIHFLPESPRWLIEQNNTTAAHAVLTRLHLDKHLVDHELAQITTSIAHDRRTAIRSWRALLTHPSLRTRLLLACGLQTFTQTSGTNVIQNYGPRLYESLGLSSTVSLMIPGIWGALAQLWNTLLMPFIDRFPRRTLLLPSLFGMGAAMCTEATLAHYIDFSNPTANTHALRAAVSMFCLFSFFFTPLGLLSWIYQAEIFPTAIRARGSALATATNWAVNLVFAQCSPIALTRLGSDYFYCFVGFNWVALGVVWVFYPETGGRSLEEVEGVFDASYLDDDEAVFGEASKEGKGAEMGAQLSSGSITPESVQCHGK